MPQTPEQLAEQTRVAVIREYSRWLERAVAWESTDRMTLIFGLAYAEPRDDYTPAENLARLRGMYEGLRQVGVMPRAEVE